MPGRHPINARGLRPSGTGTCTGGNGGRLTSWAARGVGPSRALCRVGHNLRDGAAEEPDKLTPKKTGGLFVLRGYGN
jgi:hypothetical protein